MTSVAPPFPIRHRPDLEQPEAQVTRNAWEAERERIDIPQEPGRGAAP